MTRRSLLWFLPLAFGVITAVVGVVYVERTLNFLRSVDIAPDSISRFTRDELVRWVAVTLTVVAVTAAAGVVVWFRRWQHPLVILLKGVVLAGILFTSLMAAYWPERDQIAAGLFPEPPRSAIYLPPLFGLVAVVVFGVVRPRRALKGAGT